MSTAALLKITDLKVRDPIRGGILRRHRVACHLV
jgi:hypothetical protein